MNLHETPSRKSKVAVERLAELPPEVAAWGRPYAERDKDLAYIEKHHAKLEKKYPDEWIAVFELAVVAHAKRHNDMWRQVRKLGIVEKSPVTFLIRTSEDE